MTRSDSGPIHVHDYAYPALVAEARAIVAGQSRLMATTAHLAAVLSLVDACQAAIAELQQAVAAGHRVGE